MAMGFFDKAKNFVTEKVANMEKPEASIEDVDLKGVSRECVTYNAQVAIKNPYSHSIPICELSYVLKSAGKEIASGAMPDPGSLKAEETTTLDLALKVAYGILVSLGRDVSADWDIDYELILGLTVDLPIIGQFTIPLSKKGEIKLPTLSDIF